MFWNEWTVPLRELLDLKNSPVAVTWSHAGPPEAVASKTMAVCEAVFQAAGGETVDITAANCGCQGGLVNLGLGETSPEAMVRLSDVLVNKSKVYCSPAALHRGQRSVVQPKAAGEHVTFAPLDQAALQPDLVLFVCDALRAEQVVSLCSYWDGGPLQVDLAGPMCRNALAYSLMGHRVGLSLLDDGARRRAAFAPDQMVLGVPLAHMQLAMSALERGAGRMAHGGA